MTRMTRILMVTVSGAALLVGGLAPSATAGRNVIRDVAVSHPTTCQVTYVATTSRVPSTAQALFSLYYTSDGVEQPIAGNWATVGTDNKSFTQTFPLSPPVYYNTLHVKVYVYTTNKKGQDVLIGSAVTPYDEVTCP